MVFGLFTRRPTFDGAEASPESRTNDHNAPLLTPTTSTASVAHHSPLRFPIVNRPVLGGSTTDLTLGDSGDPATDSVAEGGNHVHSPAPPPPVTPSPPVSQNEAKTLYDLMLTIPPKTLHAYTLAHLRPQPPLSSTCTSFPVPASHPDDAPRPLSPNMVNKLSIFFSTLAPPPLLHCVRCHKDFYDIENEEKDRACCVPHDDESALVSRVSGGTYETLWGCCGQIAPGDGGEGPPDGWCYEGRHTTDVKRARFRADSTVHDDRLTSCLKLNCHGIRSQLPCRDSHTHASPFRNVGTSSARRSNPSPARSQASVLMPRSARKRPRKSLKEASGSENEADAESLGRRAARVKDKEEVGDGAGGEDTSMAVDKPDLKFKAKIKSRPLSRAYPPPSTSTTTPPHTSHSNIASVVSTKARATAAKPKSTSRRLLSRSHIHLASDSEASTRSRPRTRSHVREVSRVRSASRSRPTERASKATKPLPRSPTSEGKPEAETDEHQGSGQEERGRNRKRRRVGRN